MYGVRHGSDGSCDLLFVRVSGSRVLLLNDVVVW